MRALVFKKHSKFNFILSMLIIMLIVLPSRAAGLPLKDRYPSASQGEEFQYYDSMRYRYYSDLLHEYDQLGYKVADTEPIIVPVNDIVLPDNLDEKVELIEIDGKDAFLWTSEIKEVEWVFEIVEPGLYSLELDYFMPEGCDMRCNRALYINDEVPFFEANNIIFNCLWRDISAPIVNSLGDDIWPGQEIVRRWITLQLEDQNFFYDRPFEFYFEPGVHSIKLSYISNQMAVGEARILPLDEIPSYETVYDYYQTKNYDSVRDTINVFQAEDVVIEKTDSSIRHEHDGDPLTVPQSKVNRRLNAIGGWRWRSGGQSVTLSFDVPEDGLYKISFRALQAWNNGLPSYRQIKINGQVPFKEMQNYKFEYDHNWQTVTLADNTDDPYMFYFEAGEKHTITMTATLVPYTDLLYSLDDDLILLSKVLRDINKIVGSEPDPNYDYQLDRTIPTLLDDLHTLIDSMQSKYDAIKEMTNDTPAMANNFLTIMAQLEDMKNNPFIIARRISDLNNAMNSLGNWYREMQNQPLMLDNFRIASPDVVFDNEVSSLFSRIGSTIVNFFVSFFKDYDAVGSSVDSSVEIEDVIDVWVAYGTEWAELIKELADTDFTPKTGTLVNINVLPANQLNAGAVNSLMLSIISGKAPDVALGTSATSPVEFAIRDAVYDLTNFDDFEDVKGRFLDNIFVPFEYFNGENIGVYALPETMNFNVMFYRKDIIDDINIKLPNTRRELYDDVLPVLYQNNLQFFFPADFSQFIFQHGAEYYTEDGMISALDTPEAYQAFKECAEVYTNYGVPISADFFNRMRSSEMPIGISNFRLYMLFTAAAPEIAGRWGIAPIPGMLKENGVIDRSAGGLVGECAVILNQSEKKARAWEFLTWWTSDLVQYQFAHEIESLLGVEARWNTANINAFENLPWGDGEIEVIREYWKWAREPEVVLGGYFTDRHLNNAWNRVIINGQSVRDALEEAVYDINRELKMKQEEYGIYE